MTKPAIAISLVFVVCLTLLAVYWIGFRRPRDRMGFLDYVKDPDSAERFADAIAERDAAVLRLSEEQPEVLVAMLLDDPGSQGVPVRAIRAAGPRIVPALVAALNDPKFRGASQVENLFGLPVEPVEGVLQCLQEFAPPEAVSAVQPLMEDKNDQVRNAVALLLGSIGNDEAAALVAQLLNETDDDVYAYTLMGVLRAIDADRVTDGFRGTVFDAIVPSVFSRSLVGVNDAASCLLGLDRERAIVVLTDPERFTPRQKNLHLVLAALREARVPVDDKLLTNLLSERALQSDEYPLDCVAGEAILLLAANKSEHALTAIEQGLAHPSKRTRECAAQAMAMAHGIDEPYRHLWHKVDAEGWDSLSPPQRHVLAVRMLIDEVNNGGFMQYFVNGSGDSWRDALVGLDTIDAKVDAQLLRDVLKEFGAEVPSEDRYTRHEQVAAIAERNERAFEASESQFFKDPDGHETLLLKYMSQHPNEFRFNDP